MKKIRHGESVDPTDDLIPGDVFIVKRFNGTIDESVVATLIERRDVSDKILQLNRDEKKEKNLIKPGTEKIALRCDEDDQLQRNETNSPSPVKTQNMHTLYYIHYQGLDRRLDEWVERERIMKYATPGEALNTPATLTTGTTEVAPMTRSQRRINEEFNHVQRAYTEMDAYTAKLEMEHEQRTKVKNIQHITFGDYDISTWYFSPFPDDCAKQERLYFCEYCLAYTPDKEKYICHMKHSNCKRRQPPGSEIYRKGNVSLFEVEGKSNKVYCQCLCLLSKLFMDHKTLYYDVDTFLFYILCEVDSRGAHIVGHFSKELNSDNNLACIMILPPYQRKGYGKLLIQISYELSDREGWIGTPEKPLSDLGKVSFRSYWWWKLIRVMEDMKIDEASVSELSFASRISCDDIISTLQTLQMVRYWKVPGDNVVRINQRMIEFCKSLNVAKPPKMLLDSSLLRWTPKRKKYVSPRGSQD